MRLTGCQRQPHRKSVGIDDRVNLARLPTMAPRRLRGLFVAAYRDTLSRQLARQVGTGCAQKLAPVLNMPGAFFVPVRPAPRARCS
jgi:hypothetical protein